MRNWRWFLTVSIFLLLAVVAGGMASAARVKLEVGTSVLTKSDETTWEGTARSNSERAS